MIVKETNEAFRVLALFKASFMIIKDKFSQGIYHSEITETENEFFIRYFSC